MKIEDFKDNINKDIIKMYDSSLEFYNRNISYALDALRNGELTEEEQTKYFVYINKLKERRAKLIKALKVLNSRAKKGSVIDYGDRSKYKIIGDYQQAFDKNIDFQKEISLSLHQDKYNLAVLELTASGLDSIFKRKQLERSIARKEIMLESIQQEHSKYLLNKAVDEGVMNFGLTYQEISDGSEDVITTTEKIASAVNLIQLVEFMNENDMAYKKEF